VAGDLTPAAVVRAYLARLGFGLPEGPVADRVLAEVEDGLRSAAEDGVRHGTDPARAAEQAMAEFGDPAGLAAEFVPVLVAGEAHRDGLVLLTTGPVIGGAWLAAAVLAWPVAPVAVAAGLVVVGLVLVATVPRAAYAVALTGRLGGRVERRVGQAPASAARAVSTAVRTVVVLDAALVLLAMPGLVLLTRSPTAVTAAATAATLSLARLVTAARAGRRLDRSRALLT